jgi:hypothetical protein
LARQSQGSLADDPRLKRPAALKVIRPELLRGAMRERCLKEAQAIASSSPRSLYRRQRLRFRCRPGSPHG